MRTLIFLTALALPIMAAAPQTAAASEPSIPDYDVDGACASPDRPDLARICVEQEQAAYDELKRVWPDAPVWARNAAIKATARAVNLRGYYQYLKTYLEFALQMEEAEYPTPPPHFRR